MNGVSIIIIIKRVFYSVRRLAVIFALFSSFIFPTGCFKADILTAEMDHL